MKYEAHITLERGAEQTELSYEEFADRTRELGWKASVFESDEVDGYDGKLFVSYGHDSRDHIMAELQGMYHGLVCSGFTVLRWKLEETLADSKAGDNISELIGLVVQRDLEKMG